MRVEKTECSSDWDMIIRVEQAEEYRGSIFKNELAKPNSSTFSLPLSISLHGQSISIVLSTSSISTNRSTKTLTSTRLWFSANHGQKRVCVCVIERFC